MERVPDVSTHGTTINTLAMHGTISRSASEVSISSDRPPLGLAHSRPAEEPLTAKLCLQHTKNNGLPKLHSRIGLAIA